MGLALNLSTFGCAGVDALRSNVKASAGVLDGVALVLRDLADADGAGGILDVALGFLEQGDLPNCCRSLKRYLLEGGNDPRVRAVLALLEAELKRLG
jgi:hypothetical protein